MMQDDRRASQSNTRAFGETEIEMNCAAYPGQNDVRFRNFRSVNKDGFMEPRSSGILRSE